VSLSQVDRKMKKCFGEVIETPKGCTQFERNCQQLTQSILVVLSFKQWPFSQSTTQINRVKTRFCHRVSQRIYLERIIRLQLLSIYLYHYHARCRTLSNKCFNIIRLTCI